MNRFFVWLLLPWLVVMSAACARKSEQAPADTTGPAVSAPSKAAEATLSEPRVQPKDLGRLVDLIVAEDAALPKPEFDPAALVDALGRDPQKLYEWVRDRTWWAPYRGLLRGAKGVMLDRVGSSLDRAVLLGDLLRRSGRTVRLAHSELSESLARELLARVRPIPEQRRPIQTALALSAQRQRSAEAIAPGFAEALQGLVAESKRRSDAGAELVRSQTEMLYAAVRNEATSNDSATDQSEVASLRDHWWVEFEDAGKWIAMDVLNSDAKPGNALTEAAQRSEWNAASDFPSIPDSDWHTVQIRLVVERYLAGDTSESTLFETTLRPAEVFDRPVTLIHVPKPWPAGPVESTTSSSALRDAALNVRQWTPVLRVGDRYIAQSGFTESGDVKAHPFDPTADLGGGGLFGGLDSALGGGEANEPYASAEWIDYEIHVPGRSDQRVRRQLFDLLGPGRRLAKDANFNGSAEDRRLERSEVLLSRIDILLQPCEFTSDFIAHLTVASIVAQQDAVRALALERETEGRKSRATSILEGMDIWSPLLGFASWRSTLVDRPGDWFISRPNIASIRVGRRLGADPPAIVQLIDVAANATDVRRGAGKNPFLVRLEQGVVDTVAEVLTLTGDLGAADNTAAVFDIADAAQSRGIFVAPRDTEAVQKLSWPEDETARLAADSNAGFMSYALRQPVELGGIQRVGWWRVDPASGETIGVMDTGFHPSTAEQTLVRGRVEEHAARFGLGSAAAGSGSGVAVSVGRAGMGAVVLAVWACTAHQLFYESTGDPWAGCFHVMGVPRGSWDLPKDSPLRRR